MEKLEKRLVSFEVDVNDPCELKKLIQKLNQKRKKALKKIGFAGISFGDKLTLHAPTALDDLAAIISADISALYDRLESDKTDNYYVYAHCNPSMPLQAKSNGKHLFLATTFPSLRSEPFYIGKGFGARYLDFNRNDGHRKIRSSILHRGKDIHAVKIAERMSECDAFSLEAKLIDVLGLRSLSRSGMLINLDEGALAAERRAAYPKTRTMDALLKLNRFAR